MRPLEWGPTMNTQDLIFMENEGTYENSRYERPSRRLFGNVADSQGDAVILNETYPTHDDVIHAEKREYVKNVAGATPPKQNAQQKQVHRGKEGAPKLGQFETYTVGQGACPVLDIDTPAVNKNAPENYQKRKLGCHRQENPPIAKRVQRKNVPIMGLNLNPKRATRKMPPPKKTIRPKSAQRRIEEKSVGNVDSAPKNEREGKLHYMNLKRKKLNKRWAIAERFRSQLAYRLKTPCAGIRSEHHVVRQSGPTTFTLPEFDGEALSRRVENASTDSDPE